MSQFDENDGTKQLKELPVSRPGELPKLAVGSDVHHGVMPSLNVTAGVSAQSVAHREPVSVPVAGHEGADLRLGALRQADNAIVSGIAASPLPPNYLVPANQGQTQTAANFFDSGATFSPVSLGSSDQRSLFGGSSGSGDSSSGSSQSIAPRADMKAPQGGRSSAKSESIATVFLIGSLAAIGGFLRAILRIIFRRQR